MSPISRNLYRKPSIVLNFHNERNINHGYAFGHAAPLALTPFMTVRQHSLRSTGRRSRVDSLRTRSLARGMTLVEMTVIVLVLLVLTTLLWFGATSWKNGTDRARCIMNIRQMQVSVRSYANTTPHQPGSDLSMVVPPVNVLAELVGPGKYVPELPHCPANGIYFFGGDVIPDIGQLYMSCSLASSRGHAPKDFSNW